MKQLRLSNTVCQKQLENVQRRWRDIQPVLHEVVNEEEENTTIRILFLSASPTNEPRLGLIERRERFKKN